MNPWVGEYEGYVTEICEKLNMNVCTEVSIDPEDLSDEEWRVIAAAIKENTSLKKLEIWPKWAGSPVVISVAASLFLAGALWMHPNLEELSVYRSTFAEFNAIALAIVQNKNLSRLTFEYFRMNTSLKANLTLLLKENALESLTFDEPEPSVIEGEDDDTPVDLPSAFGDNQSLKELTIISDVMARSMITADTMRDIARMLRGNQVIESLHLGPCQAETHSLIARAVRGHGTLKKLVLIGCEETDNGMLEGIPGLLTDSPALEKLCLRRIDIGEEGARQLASGLASENCFVKSLSLSRGHFGDTRVVSLAATLERNTTIESLSLIGNNIGEVGAVALATVLSHNQTLTSLDITANNIGREGAAAISDALTRNTSLQDLQLSSNPIGDDGASSLGRSLRTNHTLRSIDIGDFGDRGLKAFSSSFPHMMGLKRLQLFGVESVRSETASALLSAIERNTTLESFYIWVNGGKGWHMDEVKPRVERLIKLNRAGRRILQSQAEVPRSLWPRILGRSSCNNAEAIYFFLKQNPHLFKRQTALGKRKRGHSSCAIS